MKQNLISYAVFFTTIIVVLMSLISVIFPALIVRLTDAFGESTVNPFEIGPWAIPLLITNAVLFGLIIVYYKNKLPAIIRRSIRFVFDFEVSQKTSLVIIALLLTLYIGLSIHELKVEEEWADYIGVKAAVSEFTIEDLLKSYGFQFKYFFLDASLKIFNNIRVIPFIASISLLVLTYFFTIEITKKRFAGLVSMVILLQSHVFLLYDTTASYANFWILFYLLSLYLIYKKWYLSPVVYVFSVFSKALTAVFLPMTFFFIYRSDIPKREKILHMIPYGIVISLFLVTLTMPGISLATNYATFDSYYFWNGFTPLSYQLRFDGLILLFLLPLIVGLFIASKHKILHADSILIIILITILSAPLLSGFTYLTNQPYRFVPLVVFFAIGVGVLLSKRLLKTSEYSPSL